MKLSLHKKRLLLRLLLSSWMLTVPVNLICGYLLVHSFDRFWTYSVRYNINRPEMSLGSIINYESNRLLQKMRIASSFYSPDEITKLKPIQLFISEKNKSILESHMPQSGYEYVDAKMLQGDNLQKIELRYRGDSFYRWAWDKKSMRIKTSRDNLFEGMRHVNLLAARSPEQLNNYFSYQLAKLMGLLTPKAELVRVFVNGKDRGVHFLVEQLKETTLRQAGLMPGDLYRGEMVGKDHYVGIKFSSLFESASVWDKVAINNHYDDDSNAPLQRLIEIIQQPNSVESQSKLSQILDIEAWAKFAAYDLLTQSHHTDNIHNWRLYYDPWRQKFVPIVWDTMGWYNQLRGKKFQAEIVTNVLFEALYESEDFIKAKDEALSSFFDSGQDALFLEMVSSDISLMEQEIRTDPVLLPSNPDEVKRQMHRLAQVIASNFDTYKGMLENKPKADIAFPMPTPDSVVWSGTVIVEGNQMLDSNLTVEPGTTILMGPSASLVIKGKLLAKGTPEDPISFLPKEVGQEPWGTVALLSNTANGSRISNCRMAGGSGYKEDLFEFSAMFSIHDVKDVKVIDCVFEENYIVDDMVHTVYAEVEFSRCQFISANLDALDIDISNAIVASSVFEGSGNDGLDLMGSSVRLFDSTLKNNGDKGISVGEGTSLFAVNNAIEGNAIGVESKDGSVALMFNHDFIGNRQALNAYTKNWQYGSGGHIFLSKSKLISNDVGVSAKKDSRIYLFDSFAHPGEQDKQVVYYEVDEISKTDASRADWLPTHLQSNEMVIGLLSTVSPEQLERIQPNSRGVCIND